MIMLPNNFGYSGLSINIVDFIIVFVVEMFFFLFMTDKYHLKENSGTFLITSLLKVGTLSLILSWMPIVLDYSFKNILLFSVLLLFSGVVIDSIIFRKDMLLSKNESFDLAFKLSTLSSSAFFMIKVFFMPDYYPVYYLNAGVYNGSAMVSSSGLDFLNFGKSFGMIFLIIAFVLLFYRYSNKQKVNTTD